MTKLPSNLSNSISIQLILDFSGFIQELKKRLSEHGTNIEDPKYTSDAKTKEDIFNFGKKHNAEYIMFVTSNPDGDYLHGNLI